MKVGSDWLAMRAHHSPEKIALIHQGRQWTFYELNLWTAHAASRLSSEGITEGHRVALFLSGRPEAVLLLHGLHRLGAIPVPLNTRLSIAEIRQQLDIIDCNRLIYEHQQSHPIDKQALGENKIISLEELNLVQGLEIVIRNPPDQNISREIHFEETCVILFTSGSQGNLQAVRLSFANFYWSAFGSTLRLGNRPDDRWLACLPLFHIGGLSIIFRSCLNGNAVVLQDKFDTAETAQIIANQNPSLISLVPTMLRRLVDEESVTLEESKIRTVLIGGGKIPGPLLEQSLDLGIPICLTYGLTEATSQVATGTLRLAREKPGSVGKPLFFNQLSIHSPDEVPVGENEIGEITVSGPTVMQGYYPKESADGTKLSGRKLFTGDLGYLDSDGDLWIVGRQDGVINSGGEKVYPLEVEDALLQHPEVLEAKVFGIDDRVWGQRIATAVVPRRRNELHQDDLIDFLRPRIGSHKIPRTILFLNALPKTGSGKIDTNALMRKLETLNGS